MASLHQYLALRDGVENGGLGEASIEWTLGSAGTRGCAYSMLKLSQHHPGRPKKIVVLFPIAACFSAFGTGASPRIVLNASSPDSPDRHCPAAAGRTR